MGIFAPFPLSKKSPGVGTRWATFPTIHLLYFVSRFQRGWEKPVSWGKFSLKNAPFEIESWFLVVELLWLNPSHVKTSIIQWQELAWMGEVVASSSRIRRFVIPIFCNIRRSFVSPTSFFLSDTTNKCLDFLDEFQDKEQQQKKLVSEGDWQPIDWQQKENWSRPQPSPTEEKKNNPLHFSKIQWSVKTFLCWAQYFLWYYIPKVCLFAYWCIGLWQSFLEISGNWELLVNDSYPGKKEIKRKLLQLLFPSLSPIWKKQTQSFFIHSMKKNVSYLP